MTQSNEMFSQEAEEAVIGSLLIAPEFIEEVGGVLTERDFLILRHQMIYAALQAMHARGDAVDFVTVQAELTNRNQLQAIGGPAWLLSIINNTPSAMHLMTYAALVRRYALRRSMLGAADYIRALAMDMKTETGEALDRAVSLVMDLGGAGASQFSTMRALVDTSMDHVEQAIEHPGQAAGVPSSFPLLTKMLGGYVDGRLYVVGGRPGVGKSSMLISEAVYMAHMGYRVGLVSLEMTKEDVTNAIVGIVAGVSPKKIAEGDMTPDEYSRYVKGAAEAAALPIYVVDDESMTPQQVLGLARAWKHKHGLDVLMIDYLQYMEPPPRKGRNDYPSEYAEVTAIATALGKMAKRLHLPLIVAAQVNREVKNRADKRPTLSDLKSSGKIEEAAAVVLFPYREAYENAAGQPQPVEDVEIGIAKNRFGPRGTVMAVYVPVLKHFRASAPARMPAPKGG